MTLQCRHCGEGWGLEIVSQSYPDNGDAFESYKCSHCGARGSLEFDSLTGEQTLRGCLE